MKKTWSFVLKTAGTASFFCVALLYLLLDLFGLISGYNFFQKLAFIALSLVAVLGPTLLAVIVTPKDSE